MENLGFLIFRNDEPVFFEPGQIAQIIDGDTISLYHKIKQHNAAWTELPLKLELYENGNLIAEHSFTIGNTANSDMWLVADPSATDANGSFTSVFVNYLANLSQGNHYFEIRLYAEGNLFQTGNFSFNSDGQNIKFKEIAEKFSDIAGSRRNAAAQHQSEYEEQLKKDEEQDRQKYSYFVRIKNDSLKTLYVLAMNQFTYSEDWYEIPPNETAELDLNKGTVYVLSYYFQDQTRENARLIAEVDDLSNGVKFIVNQDGVYAE